MKLTEWPSDDAHLSEWLRPASATLRNLRAPEFAADEGQYGWLGKAAQRLRDEARRKSREAKA